MNIRLWDDKTHVRGSEGEAARWNDNDTKDNC